MRMNREGLESTHGKAAMAHPPRFTGPKTLAAGANYVLFYGVPQTAEIYEEATPVARVDSGTGHMGTLSSCEWRHLGWV